MSLEAFAHIATVVTLMILGVCASQTCHQQMGGYQILALPVRVL